MNIARLHDTTRKPLFWIIVSFISLLSVCFAYHYFSKAFSIANIQIAMDRNEALNQACIFSKKHNLMPTDYMQVATFETDTETQNFIELECGGAACFKTLLNTHYYAPYTWKARRFKEYDAYETTIFFTPDGKLSGFIQKIPETMAGAALNTEEARLIAEQQALLQGDINLSQYSLIEASQLSKVSNRIDHTFIYEHIDEEVNNISYRLTLVVSGDKLTELKRSIKIPEAFKRRYEEMRSHNNIISLISLVFIILLYICGGCFLGLFFLRRHTILLWKGPLICGTIFALLNILQFLNQLPLQWSHYNSALNINTFMVTLLINTLVTSSIIFIFYTLVIAAAENLTRTAFPTHIQLWKLWTIPTAGSYELLGMTLGGYLIVGFSLALSVGTYYIALHYFGWWTPTETLYDPNILAHYIPWLSPTIQALNAGFIEECLFRAIPLACAVIIGNRYGHRTFWITSILIVQAFIFGGAHANYPTAPAYARLLELIIPSLIFGILYLCFGLLPAIISHFTFDIILMALPIFVASTPYIWIDKSLVIICTLIPLFIVVYARLKNGQWMHIPFTALNRDWMPPVEATPLFHKRPEYTHISFSLKKILSISLCGCIGAMLWILFTPFKDDSLHLTSTKQQAVAKACNHLEDTTDISLNDFQPLAKTTIRPSSNTTSKGPSVDEQHIFIWRTAGKNIYHTLLGSYLQPPVWDIRFLKSTGTLSERSEEYQLYISNGGCLLQNKHQLPEDMSKETLNETNARILALDTLHNRYSLEEDNVIEVSAVPSKFPYRQDWIFTFKTILPTFLHEGEARIDVTISGTEVTNIYKYIFIPEEWSRKYKEEQTIILIVQWICILLLSLLIFWATIYFFKTYQDLPFSYSVFFGITLVLIIKSIILAFNMWPSITASFSTAQSYTIQTITICAYWIIIVLFKSIMLGIMAGFLKNIHLCHRNPATSLIKRLPIAIFTGTFFMGLYAILYYYTPQLSPFWVDFAAAAHRQPFLSIALINFTQLIEYTLLSLSLLLFIDHISHGWYRRKWATGIMVIFLSILMVIAIVPQKIIFSLIAGLLLGISVIGTYIFIFRFDRTIIPLTIGTIIALQAIEFSIINPYPQAFAGGILTLFLIPLCAIYASQFLTE